MSLTTEDTEGTERVTPETDALILSKSGFGPTDWEWRVHARRLERERDEAQEKYFAMRDLSNNATELAEKYKQERDEARLVARYLYKQLRKKLMEKVELDLHKSWEERSPWLFEEESK